VDHACNAEDGVLAVPVDSNVGFLRSGEGEVDGIFGGGVEDVCARLEVRVGGARLLEAETFGCGVEVDTEAVT